MPSTGDMLTNLDAEVDALVDPTTYEVYAVTKDYDSDLVAASGVRRAGGGGGGGASPLQLLGPFTVDYNDAGVNNNKIDVADLTVGTIIIRAWAFKTQAWVAGSSGFEFSLEIGDAGDTTNGVVLDYPAVQGDVQAHLEEANAPNYGDTRWRAAIVTGSGWKLRASVWVNGPDTLTSGSIDFYALAYVPA